MGNDERTRQGIWANIAFDFMGHDFDVCAVRDNIGNSYRVELASWPTRKLHGKQVPITSQSAIVNQVAKVGYILYRYSSKSDDMFLIVEKHK